MEFFNPLTFRYNGTVQSGEGLCTEIFERLAMNITHEDFKKRFLEGPIPMVPTDPEFVKACRAATVNLPTVTKSSVIESSDGVPLTWFIKKGMSSPWGRIGRVLIRLSDDAVRLLTRRYPPPQKIETNARYIANLEEQKAKASADNKLFGVYHFFLWRTEGGRGFTVSKESRPNDAKEAAAVEDYLHRTRWQHILLSKWLKALASETWKTYWEAYQRQRERGDLGVLDDGDMGCFSGRALLIQAVVNPHKDDTDVRGGLVLTFPTGLYGGGEVTIFEYGLRFAQEAGDILIAPMQVLTHMLDPIYGYRHGNVYTVKEEVLNPPKRPFICDICSLDYKAKSSLNQHKNETRGGKDLGGLHMAARARKDFDAYKKFGRNPAVKLDEFMESWDDPAEFRYPCDYPGCNATSTTTRGVKTHKVNIHGEKRGEQGDEDDACGCGCSC